MVVIRGDLRPRSSSETASGLRPARAARVSWERPECLRRRRSSSPNRFIFSLPHWESVLSDRSDPASATASATSHCPSAVRGRTIATMLKICEVAFRGLGQSTGDSSRSHSCGEWRRGAWRVLVNGGPLGVAGWLTPSNFRPLAIVGLRLHSLRWTSGGAGLTRWRSPLCLSLSCFEQAEHTQSAGRRGRAYAGAGSLV
jgi:hypothetical protein